VCPVVLFVGGDKLSGVGNIRQLYNIINKLLVRKERAWKWRGIAD
jgi:hypothetical protein